MFVKKVFKKCCSLSCTHQLAYMYVCEVTCYKTSCDWQHCYSAWSPARLLFHFSWIFPAKQKPRTNGMSTAIFYLKYHLKCFFAYNQLNTCHTFNIPTFHSQLMFLQIVNKYCMLSYWWQICNKYLEAVMISRSSEQEISTVSNGHIFSISVYNLTGAGDWFL